MAKGRTRHGPRRSTTYQPNRTDITLVLGGLVGVAAIVIGLWHTIGTLVEWQAVQAWKEVPAQIRRSTVESYEDRDGHTRHRLKAAFSYTHEGTEYTSERIFFNSGSEERDQAVGQRLADMAIAKEATTCYVNPQAPDEAILYRQLSLHGLAFWQIVIIFPGFFVFAMPFAVASVLNRRHTRQQAEQHPREPWRWQATWASPTFTSDYRPAGFGILAASTLLVISASPSLFFWGQELDGSEATIHALAFVGCAVLLAGVALHLLRTSQTCSLHLDSGPCTLGGTLRGRFTSPRQAQAKQIHVQLSCNVGRQTKDLTITPAPHAGAKPVGGGIAVAAVDVDPAVKTDGMHVYFELPVPAPNPESTTLPGEGDVRWSIQVSWGSGLKREVESFAIPVFQPRTPAGQPAEQPTTTWVPEVADTAAAERTRRRTVMMLIGIPLGVAALALIITTVHLVMHL